MNTNRIRNAMSVTKTLHDDLASRGGQYAPPVGVSTRDQTDRQRDLEALRDFEAAMEAECYGVVSGRGW